MKKLPLVLLITAIFLSSCLNNNRNVEDTDAATEAFEDESLLKDISSYKRAYESVSDKLYNELLEKDDALKALEEKILLLEEDLTKDNVDLNKFFSNNSAYYNDIKTQSETVKDTVLRDLLIQKINESEHLYSEKIKEIKVLKEILTYKVEVLKDYRTAMKIILTEQSMQEYQDNFKQDTAMLHSLIGRYEKTIEDIQSKIEE
jgi:hypothetical protein